LPPETQHELQKSNGETSRKEQTEFIVRNFSKSLHRKNTLTPTKCAGSTNDFHRDYHVKAEMALLREQNNLKAQENDIAVRMAGAGSFTPAPRQSPSCQVI